MKPHYDPQAHVDEFAARYGDLDARERVLKRRRLERLERHDAAETAAQSPAAAVPVAQPTAAAVPRRSKGVADGTLHAIRAICAVVYDEPKFPRKALPLAVRAAEKAQELELPGADALNPRGSSMREIAAAVLEGLKAIERE